METQPTQPVDSIFAEDEGGNSTLTRLQAELSCMHAKGDREQVTDSSLTYGDLRLLRSFIAEIGHPPENVAPDVPK